MIGAAVLRRSLLAASMLIPALASAVTLAQSNRHADDEELRRDLRAVIILAGYPCRSIDSFSHPNPSDYDVSCSSDLRYRVHVSEDRGVVVQSPSEAAGAVPEAGIGHDAFMRRQYFAILNLAGHPCDRVLSFERRGPRESLVACDDQTVYRIHVTPEGRVAVEKHPVAK